MSPSRARYVTACQQLLALGVVVIALVPATRVVSLDVVGVRPGDGAARPTVSVPEGVGMSGYARTHQRAQRARGEVSLRVAERRTPQPRCAHRPGRTAPGG
jgi:hypothetical protein